MQDTGHRMPASRLTFHVSRLSNLLHVNVLLELLLDIT